MNCFKAQIPDHLQSVKDELKAMYQSKDSICIWIFKNVSEKKQIYKRDDWNAKRGKR